MPTGESQTKYGDSDSVRLMPHDGAPRARARTQTAAKQSARASLSDARNIAAVTTLPNPALYRQLAKLLKLAPDEHSEQVFKQILGNCQSIVESLGAIRNKLGDANSQGPKRAKPLPRHAELAVNLAGTMATFLISTWEARREANGKSATA